MVLFIDEIHTIVGAGQGGGEGGLDIANMFKPALARGELNLIGATTLNEYQKHIEKDAALERRFQPVLVPEPTVAQTIMILRGLRDTLEAHHKVAITDEAIIAAAELSDRYVTGRFLPDKAIDLIDQAAARVKISATARPVDVQDLEAEVRQLKREQDYASSRKKFERSKDLQAQHDAKAKELETAQRALAARARLGLGRGAHRAHRPGGVEAHRHPGDRADERGARAPDQDGGTAAPARHRPGRGRQGGERRRAPGARRAAGGQPADRHLPVPRPDRRRQDRAGKGARRGGLWRRGRHDPHRHVGIHGAPRGRPPHRRAARLCRLRGRRAAHRARAAAALFASCCSTRSRRRMRTSTTSCFRSSTTAGSPTARAGSSTSPTRS